MGLSDRGFKFSNTYPLATGTGLTSLATNDVAIYQLLDFFSACLVLDGGARWTEIVNQLKAQGLAQAVLPTFCSPTTLPYNPYYFMPNSSYQFPLLAMFRGKGTVSEFTRTTILGMEGSIELLFILPAINSEECESLTEFLVVARDIISYRSFHGSHPLYNGGELVGPLTGLAKMGISNYEFTTIQNSDLIMPTLRLTLKIQEVNQAVSSNVIPFTGIDFTLYKDGYVLDTDGYYSAPDGYKYILVQVP